MSVLKSKISISEFFFNLAIFSYALNLKPIVLNFQFGDALILVLLFLSATGIFSNSMNAYRTYRKGACAYFIFIFALLIIGISANGPEKHLTGLLQYIYVYFVQVPVILFFARKNFNMTLRSFIAGAVLAAVLVLLFNFYNITIASSFIEYSLTGGIFRRTGIGGINDFGFIIAAAMVMAFILNSRGDIANSTFLILAIFLTFMIVVSASRSSFLLLVVFFGLVAFKGRVMKSLALGFALISLFYVSYDYIDILKNVERFSLGLSNSGDRLEQYRIAGGMIIDEPFGIGLGSYMDGATTDHPVHNIFLLLAVEGGVLSSVCFVIFWMILMADSFFRKPNGYVSFAIIFSVLVYMQTITHVYDRFFWIVIAVAIVFANLPTNKNGKYNLSRGPL